MNLRFSNSQKDSADHKAGEILYEASEGHDQAP